MVLVFSSDLLTIMQIKLYLLNYIIYIYIYKLYPKFKKCNYHVILFIIFYLYFPLVVKVSSRFVHLVFLHVSAGILMQTTRKYIATNEMIFSENASKVLRKIKIKIQ